MAARRPLAMRIGYDPWAISLSCRSIALWALGLPDAAEIDREQALGFKIDYAAILMSALSMVFLFNSLLATTPQLRRNR